MVYTLTQTQARTLHLAAQGLSRRPRARATRQSLLDCIMRMQMLQIDTINVVERSPYVVLFSRLGSYPVAWLMEHLEKATIFECWGHEACFAPIKDYPLHRVNMARLSRHWSIRRAQRVRQEHAASMQSLLDHVREHGAVSSGDFERSDGSVAGGWWGWKAEKSWLEAWFALGELMIRRRVNFQRVYDLRERVLAAQDYRAPNTEPAPQAVREAFIVKTVTALGVSQSRWIADYFRMSLRVSDAELEPLVASGQFLKIQVQGWEPPAYVASVHREQLEAITAGALTPTHSCVLSPFDPVVWDRERASTLFDFDYRLECYTPAEKRVHGYFVLPILSRGRIVGRMDAKAHRAEGVFEVRAFSLQPKVRRTAGLARNLAKAIRAFAHWHGSARIEAAGIDWSHLREWVEAPV